MFGALGRLRGSTADCTCDVAFDGNRLVVDADDCPGEGRLEAAPDCRETVVRALTDRDADRVSTTANGVERAYEGDAAALLLAAGRFADRAAFHDESLAVRAQCDPLRAGRQAAGRSGPVARIAAETGLAEGAARAEGYEDGLRPFVGPTVADSRVAVRPPADARLADRRDLPNGTVVRVYERPGDELQTYHLVPPEHGLDAAALATLDAAHERLARGEMTGGERAPGRAVRAVAPSDAPVGTLAAVLEKHTRGNGVLDDCFADPECSDVFVTAPAAEGTLRVCVDDETMRTNVRLTDRGADTLASRYRRESGRSFSRASPTLDATTHAGDRRVRVAGVTRPVSDGVAFAFRARERAAWTLPALVGNGTVPPDAAALLSLAVERGAACLVAGGRGAGKTTLLGALCFELPAAVRTVAIEDTPELPVGALSRTGRDVQRLRATTGRDDAGGLTPTAALRTALRLGEGALVVGEVRGEEAPALFEAMRVGANERAVLGTVHGEGGTGVRDRTRELGVPASAFVATDLLVTCESTADGRRVAGVEEVFGSGGVGDDADGIRFAPLFERDGDGLAGTGRLARGDSRLAARLARPDESYADLLATLDARESWLRECVDAGDTDAAAVVDAHARRRAGDR
ncbi:ATPase, T2SS/T4P/T4SS family [Halomarina litorea]|uniref:ATPase, T2SS/T4P/T4SS family n=1 Tax=Halomarina litorea TaxID=2961595 RepID=UPI0020C4A3CE|nr:ATPase, T2SS/T4P/T4SS family [Halomarina sp. BCD28]